MTRQRSEEAAPAATRGASVLTGAATVLTLVGAVLAVTRPEWLTQPLTETVSHAGLAAPLVYMLLCTLAAPLHLGGVLVALSPLTFPLAQAIGLSWVGLLLGNLLTYAALSRVSGAALKQRSAWPALLQRLALQVDRRPVGVGVVARLALGCGGALETFFLATSYSRRTYLLVTVLGTAGFVTQAVLGVTLLHQLLKTAPALAGLLALSPLVLVGVATAAGLKRRRTVK